MMRNDINTLPSVAISYVRDTFGTIKLNVEVPMPGLIFFIFPKDINVSRVVAMYIHSPMMSATAFSALPAAETIRRLSFFNAWSQFCT